jgi:hypothetical protein
LLYPLLQQPVCLIPTLNYLLELLAIQPSDRSITIWSKVFTLRELPPYHDAFSPSITFTL